ncbi:MAG: sterol desaturase family protein, partial [Myxococcales bacterium]|nr:sterol desaturase family protein [Myxococcales bacterium]
VTTVSPRILVVGGLIALHTAVFWPLCLAFDHVDRSDRPEWIARHRIQRTMRKHPPLRKTIPVLLRNQFLILPPLILALTELMLARGWHAEATLPSPGRLVFELAVQALCAEVIFYASHRFLHRKWWLKRVHHIHHEFRTTTAFASEYAHPVEFVFGNFLTLAGGALLLAPHLFSIYLFALLALLTFVIHHSGYALPWAPWSIPHDWHHFRARELFGVTGQSDALMGTDQEFRTLRDGDER